MSAKRDLDWSREFEEIRTAIAASYLADGLDEHELGMLARLGTRHRFKTGEVIVQQDDEEAHLLILAKGRAEISTFTDEPMYYLRPGMPFGEVALIDEKPRSATVKATEASEIIQLPAGALRDLMSAHPQFGMIILRNLAKLLCTRVRAMNQQIAVLQTLEELREGRA